MIDTLVFAMGSRLGENASQVHRDFLISVIEHETLVLAVDERGQIDSEYDRILGTDPAKLGRLVLTHLASKSRKVKYPWESTIAFKPLRLALEAEHFSPDDMKFVQTAKQTNSRTIVSEDDDYSSAVCKILKKDAGIRVLTTGEAHAEI